MSVIEITPDLVEINTLLLQPSQSFSSSSLGEIGCIRFYQRPTNTIKQIPDQTYSNQNTYTETVGVTKDDDQLYDASQSYAAGNTNTNQQMQTYMTNVNQTPTDPKNDVKACPRRIQQPSQFAAPEMDEQNNIVSFLTDPYDWQNMHRRIIKNCLIPNNLVENPRSFYGYTNYNSINFISSSNFPTASAIIFPNFPDSSGVRDYTPDKEFTVDFFIKPKAPIDEIRNFRAGTILHISSSICISLISGSSQGADGKPDKFRIMLQLSQSADTKPSDIDPNSFPLTFPKNFIFASPDSLSRDTWHRVTIRWGTNQRSIGSGSIQVDQMSTRFNVNLPSISTGLQSDALFVGNYYEGSDRNAKFFNNTAAAQFGTIEDPVGGTTDPVGAILRHPLNAEIHHLSIFKRYLSSDDLSDINSLYKLSSIDGGPSFFLPPFFSSSIPASVVAPLTPRITNEIFTDSPISYRMSLGYNALFSNTQNFLIDFAKNKQSRAYLMSEFNPVVTPFDARDGTIDDIIMLQPPVRRRNFTIFPCDDGNFSPDFSILDSDSTRFHNLGVSTSSMMISMNQLAPTGSYLPLTRFGTIAYDGTDIDYLPLLQDMNFGTVKLDQADLSSNRVVIFSIPSIFYLRRIVPETFVLTDLNLSGSGGISMTLKDDGRGNLYRADCASKQAAWNTVGSIFYSHGAVIIVSPHVPFFGKTGFEMSFRGEVRKTVANFLIPAKPDAVNYSYNPAYNAFPPTNLRSEQADDFTYITGINLHDENLNVVMRAKLAQSIQKRDGDEIVFRLRYDF